MYTFSYNLGLYRFDIYRGRVYCPYIRGVVPGRGQDIKICACKDVLFINIIRVLTISNEINSILPICCTATQMVQRNITYGALQHDSYAFIA